MRRAQPSFGVDCCLPLPVKNARHFLSLCSSCSATLKMPIYSGMFHYSGVTTSSRTLPLLHSIRTRFPHSSLLVLVSVVIPLISEREQTGGCRFGTVVGRLQHAVLGSSEMRVISECVQQVNIDFVLKEAQRVGQFTILTVKFKVQLTLHDFK